MYETVNVPEELKQFVPNLKINVFDIAWLSEKQISMFKSDFRIVADYFMQIRKTGTFAGNLDDMKHVYEILELLGAMENDDRFTKAYYYEKVKGGLHNMSDVLNRIEEMAVEKKEKELNEKYTKEKEDIVITFAKRMLAKGMPQSEVVELSGLCQTEVAELAKSVAVN